MNKLLMMLCLLPLLIASCKKEEQGNTASAIAAQAAIDDKIITDYIQSNNLSATARRVNYLTPSSDTIGVWYIIQNNTQRVTLYNSTSTLVTVGYIGKILTTGKEFARTGVYHPSFRLGEVIRGWQVGIPKINIGGTVRLLIPSRYAYGPYEQTALGLPPNSVLDFEIELFDVTN